MSVGFVSESQNRKAVMSELAAGEKDAARIAKKHRLIPRAVDNALAELVEKGLVAKGKEGYGLTQEGERVVAELHQRERPS